MRPIQWHLKDCWSPMVDDLADQISLSKEFRNSSSGPTPVPVLDLTASGVWSKEESAEHISVLEMKAVSLDLAAFLPQLLGQSVVLMSDNALVVAYLRHQGGTVSRALSLMASEITMWTEQHSVCLSARYISGRKSILADQNSHDLPTEWSLPRVFEGSAAYSGIPISTSLPLEQTTSFHCVSPVKQDASQHPWDHLSTYAFPLFTLLRQVLSRVLTSTGLSLAPVALLWPQNEWFTDLLSLLADEPLKFPQVWNLLVQPHVEVI